VQLFLVQKSNVTKRMLNHKILTHQLLFRELQPLCLNVQLQEFNKEFLLTSRKKNTTKLRADQKFLLVPAVFMVLRVWDIVASVIFQYADVKGKHLWLTFLDVSLYVCTCVCVVCVHVFMRM